jgi:hypothetical protein
MLISLIHFGFWKIGIELMKRLTSFKVAGILGIDPKTLLSPVESGFVSPVILDGRRVWAAEDVKLVCGVLNLDWSLFVKQFEPYATRKILEREADLKEKQRFNPLARTVRKRLAYSEVQKRRLGDLHQQISAMEAILGKLKAVYAELLIETGEANSDREE